MNSEYYQRNETGERISRTANAVIAIGVIFGLGAIGAGCWFISNTELVFFNWPFGLGAIVGGVAIILGALAAGFVMKGFSAVLDNIDTLNVKVSSIENTISTGMAGHVRTEQAYREKQAQLEEAERQRAAEAKRKAAEQVQRQLELARAEAEERKKERIEKYWAAHKEEYDELTSQREDAKEALSNPEDMTDEEKKELEDFIVAVDRKLSKDRPQTD